MNKKAIIRKVIVLAAWFLVIAGITTLLIAANNKKKEHICREVVVGIKAPGEKFCIEESDIKEQLEKAANGSLINRPLTSISLVALEKTLEKDQWIRDAELYFDRDDVLHVLVEEREPIARVFTTGGASFYMDSSGHRMPLLEKLSIRLPVVTGFVNARKLNARDSVMLRQMKDVVKVITKDPFWNAQVGQIDITAERKFELIPVIGDHVIRIGEGEQTQEKLDRLLLFYKQVLSKAGFNKYSVVDVQFAGQVIGEKKGSSSKVDSIQLKKNIKELLEKSTIQNVSDEMLPEEKTLALKDSIQAIMTAQNNSVAMKTNPTPVEMGTAKRTDPNPGKKTTMSAPEGAKEKSMVEKTSVKPKAVMKKRA